MVRYMIVIAVVAAVFWSASQSIADSTPSAAEIGNLIERLASPGTGREAAKRLVDIGTPAIPELEAVLDRRGDTALKIAAIGVLSESHSRESAAAIKRCFADPDPSVKRVALSQAFRLQEEKCFVSKEDLWVPCQQWLRDEDSDLRNAAARCLAIMDRRKAVPLLLETLDREFKKPKEKRGTYQRPETMSLWGEDATINVCSNWLGLVPKECEAAIVAYIGRGTRDLDYCLAEVLLGLGHTPIYSELLIEGATKCSSAGVRARIIYGLWNVDDSRVAGILKDALNDPYTVLTYSTSQVFYPIRSNAATALKKLDAKAKGLHPAYFGDALDSEPKAPEQTQEKRE